MKSLLLYANEDAGFESRLQASLDLLRRFDGHLACLQVTPFDSFIMGDPFGGVYALPAVMEQVRKVGDAHRERVEARLRSEGVSWDWLRYDGSPAQIVTDRSRLADLILLSLPGDRETGENRSLPLIGDVVIHSRAPVLAVPPSSGAFDPLGAAMIAWNGSPEGGHALRLALPMLKTASAVHIVTIVDDQSDFPAIEACQYLARHDVAAELHEWSKGDRTVSEALVDAATTLRASVMIMGGYGHSRLREAVLGGTTRDLLETSRIPLLLAH